MRLHEALAVLLLLLASEGNGTNLLEFIRTQNRSVLCIGDSLTHGMVPIGPHSKITHTPYSTRLDSLLNNDLLGSAASRIEVHEYGLDGEHTLEMKERLKNIIAVNALTTQNTKSPHHIGLVIILGGTNDVCDNSVRNDTVIASLSSMHALIHSLSPKAFTIAITLPDMSPWMHEIEHRNKYKQINEGIRGLQKASRSRIVGLLEMENKWIPREVPESKRYWSQDNVHLSELGYKNVGEMLYEMMRDTRIED